MYIIMFDMADTAFSHGRQLIVLSANLFNNFPRQKKVLCMYSKVQILCFYYVGRFYPRCIVRPTDHQSSLSMFRDQVSNVTGYGDVLSWNLSSAPPKNWFVCFYGFVKPAKSILSVALCVNWRLETVSFKSWFKKTDRENSVK